MHYKAEDDGRRKISSEDDNMGKVSSFINDANYKENPSDNDGFLNASSNNYSAEKVALFEAGRRKNLPSKCQSKNLLFEL